MIVVQRRFSKVMINDTEISPTIEAACGCGGVTYRYCWSLDEKMGQTYVHHETANTLAARDYKQPQAVILIRDGRTDID